ncbi:MAG TPA: FmdE family protein [Terriglobia bacterium]|nr:FmdE family protein [Terriglobia bacterium]
MKTLDEYLALAAQHHGHMCPGQVLGVRMAMLGLRELGIDDPARHRKRLITYVEIDRCATDAVSLVTGCRLGSRSLKYFDYGKVAATFFDVETERAVRVVARDDSRERAKAMFPELARPAKQQLEAYKVLPDSELFIVRPVRVNLKPGDLPGGPRSCVACQQCGEGVNNGRERRVKDRILCRSCAGESYYEEVTSDERVATRSEE